MDKQTLSGYGWIVIVTLVLAVLLALATPFGTYVGDGVVTTVNGLINTSSKAVDEDQIDTMSDKWENKFSTFDKAGSVNNGSSEITPEEETLAPGLYKTDGTFVSWEDLTSTEYIILTNNCCIAEQPIITVNESYNSIYTAWGGCCAENLSSLYLNGKLIISDNISRIDGYGFVFCKQLTSITISDSVTSMGMYAFAYCDNFSTINYKGTQEQWNAIELTEAWNLGCPEITVHCTDGDILIPASN